MLVESVCYVFFFFKQKTAYEIPKRDWSSDVCSSDLAVLVKLDRRIRHLLRHARAEEEDVLVGRRVIGGPLGEPLEHPRPPDRVGRQEFAGLLAKIHQDRPGLDQGQRLAAGPVGIDQSWDPRGRVDLEVIGLFLVALREV